MTKDALIQLITDHIADNQIGDITPEKLREVLFQMLESNSAGLEQDIEVKGVTVGNLTDGTLLLKDESITSVFMKMLVKEIAASYSAPSGSISSTVTGNVEAGTLLTNAITATFTQRDAGSLNKYVLKRGTTILVDNPTIQAYNENFTIGDATLSYQATFSYAEGPTKNTNLGNPSPDNKILAGSVNSTSVSIVGRRNAFYDVDKPTASSANIRTFAGKLLNPVQGSSFTIIIPAGTSSVEFAYPATLRDVFKVLHEESNLDVKGVFQKETVNVAGANGFSSIQYKFYKYTPDAPFSGSARYTITI